MPGRAHREDVRELVSTTDDRFVVSRPGDEIAISFRAFHRRPPDGRAHSCSTPMASAEMDRNSASPDVAEPLPYHHMQSYPGDPLSKPMTASQRAYVERYNTRVVTRAVPSLAAPAQRSRQ
jgi:hypothetical protein